MILIRMLHLRYLMTLKKNPTNYGTHFVIMYHFRTSLRTKMWYSHPPNHQPHHQVRSRSLLWIPKTNRKRKMEVSFQITDQQSKKWQQNWKNKFLKILKRFFSPFPIKVQMKYYLLLIHMTIGINSFVP